MPMGSIEATRCLYLEAEGVAHGDAALLHGSGSQRGEADDVAGGVNVGDRGAVIARRRGCSRDR